MGSQAEAFFHGESAAALSLRMSTRHGLPLYTTQRITHGKGALNLASPGTPRTFIRQTSKLLGPRGLTHAPRIAGRTSPLPSDTTRGACKSCELLLVPNYYLQSYLLQIVVLLPSETLLFLHHRLFCCLLVEWLCSNSM